VIAVPGRLQLSLAGISLADFPGLLIPGDDEADQSTRFWLRGTPTSGGRSYRCFKGDEVHVLYMASPEAIRADPSKDGSIDLVVFQP